MVFGSRRTSQETSRRQRRRNWSRLVTEMLQLHALEERRMLAGAATQLIYLDQPSQTAANSPMSLVEVEVLDANGQLVTSDKSTVVLTIGFLSGAITGAEFKNGATANYSTSVSVVVNNGIATFSSLFFNTPGANYFLSAGDNSATLPFIATSNTFTITNAPTKVVFTTPPAGVTAGQLFSVTADVEDSVGNLVSTDQSKATITLTGPGSLTGSTTTTASGGVITFGNLKVSQAGTYTIKITDGTLTSTSAASFPVSAGTASTLIFAQKPADTAVNTPLPTMIVDIEDTQGNLVTGNNSAVTLVLVQGNQTVNSNLATVNALNGVATFSNVTINNAEPGYQIFAVDAGLTNASSNTFNVYGPAAGLLFKTNPSQTTVGEVIRPPVVVDVIDANGSIVPTDNSAVSLVLSGGPGSLSGTATVSAVNGVATFSNLSVSAEGNGYTLLASDSGLQGATSTTFLINGLPTQLVFNVQPLGTSAGAQIPNTVSVTIEDAEGNTVVNSSASVSMTLSPTTGTLTGATTVAAVDGIATFSLLTPSREGTFELVASSNGLTEAISQPFDVAPGAAFLVFIQEPGNTAAKSTIFPGVTVAIEDNDGNIVTSNTSTITLTISRGPANATFGGTTTVTAINGTASFSDLSLQPQGTYTIVAHSGNLGTATSESFVVTPMALHLAWKTQPPPVVTAGQPFSFSVRVNDSTRSLVSSDHSTVTLAIGTGPTGATIIGNVTASTIDGVATFTGIELDKSGRYTFQVTDGSLTGATSSAFTVIPDLANGTNNYFTKLIANSTNSTLAGHVIPTLTIEVTDEFGNVRSSYNGPVTLGLDNNGSFASFDSTVFHGAVTVIANHGIARFSNVWVSAAGNYAIADQIKVDGVELSTGEFTNNTLTITPVITKGNAPAHAATYKVGQTITLRGNITSLVASPRIKYTGDVEIIDALTSQTISGFTVVPVGAGGGYTITGTGIAPGVYTLRVYYDFDGSDPNHTATLSQAFKLTVGPTSTALHGLLKTVTAGTVPNETLTATIAAGLGVKTARTGTVEFFDGTTMIGTATVSDNIATLAVSFATTGSQAITAVYLGDNVNFAPSTSSAFTVMVKPAIV